MRSFAQTALALGLLALLPRGGNAQAELGVRAGVTSATIGGDNTENVESRTVFNVGAFATIPVYKVVGLQIGVSYAQKGAKQFQDGDEVVFKLDYLEVPILARINVPTQSELGLHLLVGTALGFRTSCSVESATSSDCDDTTAFPDGLFSSFNVDVAFGGGLDFDVGPRTTFTVEALGNFGLNDLDETSPGLELNHRTVSFLAGLAFALGG